MAEFDDKVYVTKQKLTNIADQIRAELSENDEYKLDVMPTKIHEVAQGGGGSAVINPLSITANGTYTATGNVDGYSPVTVAVEPDLEDITITQNGNYKSSQHDGYDDVIVNVAPDLEDITITQNGTYISQNKDGYNEVTVNVSGGGNLETLTVTANGTYTPTSPVDGYDEVIVNVSERLLYKWDFKKSTNPLVDEVRGQTGNLSGQVAIGASGYSTDGFTRFDPLLLNNNLVLDGFKTRFRVKFGEFFSQSHSSGEKGRLFSFGTSMALYWNDVPMLYGSGVGGVYRLTALDNKFDILEDDELIVDFYKDGNNYKATWTFPDGTVIDYGTIDLNSYIILGEYQYTDNGLGGVYVEGLEIELIPIPITPNQSRSVEAEETNEKSVEKETIEEKTDEVKEQKKESVEKLSELDA